MWKMSVLLLILLNMSGVYADSHSLSYHFTAVSAKGFGLPEFCRVGYVDDQQIDVFTSDVGRTVPVAPWMKTMSPEYWASETLFDIEAEAVYRHEAKTGSSMRPNDTIAFHLAQVLLICDPQDDGSTKGSMQFRYDGSEYMYFDLQSWTFIPFTAEAQIKTQKLNSPNGVATKMAKNYIQYVCNTTMKRVIEHGRDALERRVHPGVKVTGRESDGVTKLHCLVYGFYPRAVDVKWMKNGIDEIPSYETTHVLPNPDGTYQIRVTVEVIPQEGNSYSCYVDHSSLEEPLLVKWESKEDSPLAVIISAAIIGLVLTSVTAGVIIYRKKKNNYTAARDERS